MKPEVPSDVAGVGSARLERLRAEVGDLGVDDRILITSSEDVRWLSGFSGSNGWLVVGPDTVHVLTDGRYSDQVQMEAKSMGLEPRIAVLESGQRLADLVARVVPGKSPSARVLFSSTSVSVAQLMELESACGSKFEPKASLAGARRRKDDAEIDAMARAARIADQALLSVLPMMSERPTERDVRDEVEYRMRRLGAEGPSYDTIVASGPVNSAKPHHRPDSTIIEEGHCVVIDVGALVDGYHSDMTRTFFVGEVDEEIQRFYEIVREGQSRAIRAVGPGVPCAEVDRTCRDFFEECGVAALFIHGIGHGVGLAIHEEPFIGRTASCNLQPGDVVTVEPGLYRMGLGGVRIEDLLVVTEDSHRCLTSLPKDSPCLPSQRTI